MATVQNGVVLCGPPCAGKTVSGRLVAKALGWSFADADLAQASYLAERGWDDDSFGRRVSEAGRHGAYLEYEVLMADYLSAVLAEHPAGVVALGAGHAHALGCEPANRMAGTLRDEPRPVVRLLPDPDSAVSCVVIRARTSSRGDDTYLRPGRDLIAEWIESHVMEVASDHTLYAYQDGPAAVADSLAQLVNGTDGPGGGQRTDGS